MQAPENRSLDPRRSRRRFLALLGAGGAAALGASLARPSPAEAGHDGTNVMHLGESNAVADDALTRIAANADNHAVTVHNTHAGDVAGAMRVLASGGKPALLVESDRSGGSAIVGTSSGPGFGEAGQYGEGDGTGVQGESRTGTGVHGTSREGVGILGESDTGVGGSFSSPSLALAVGGPARFEADFEAGAIVVANVNAGQKATAVAAQGIGNAIIAACEGSGGVAIQGVSSAPGGFADGDGVGLQGQSGTGTGVQGFSVAGLGVDGSSPDGTGGFFSSESGLALDVLGAARFSTAGEAAVPAGQSSVFVAESAVTEHSHVSVSLVGDPGPRVLSFVERDPGAGFTVHLTAAPPRRRQEAPFTYLVVEHP